MTDKQIAVKVDHVSKYFKLPTEATNSLRTALVASKESKATKSNTSSRTFLLR